MSKVAEDRTQTGTAKELAKTSVELKLGERTQALIEQASEARDALQALDEGMHGVMSLQRRALFASINASRSQFRDKLEDVEQRVQSPEIKEVVSALRSAELPPATLTKILGEFLSELEKGGAKDLANLKETALEEIRQAEAPLRRQGAKIVAGIRKEFAEDLAAEGGVSEGRMRQEVSDVTEELRHGVMTLLTSTISERDIMNHVKGMQDELRFRASSIRRSESAPAPEAAERMVKRILRETEDTAA